MFRSDRDGGNFPFVRPANRSAEEKLVAKVETVFLTDWSNDDRIAFHSGTSGWDDVGILDRASGAKPSFVAASKFTEIDGRFSPNKRWFAYASDRSDKMRVMLAAAGSAGAGVPVGEGSEPHWGKDSDKLYFCPLTDTSRSSQSERAYSLAWQPDEAVSDERAVPRQYLPDELRRERRRYEVPREHPGERGRHIADYRRHELGDQD